MMSVGRAALPRRHLADPQVSPTISSALDEIIFRATLTP